MNILRNLTASLAVALAASTITAPTAHAHRPDVNSGTPSTDTPSRLKARTDCAPGRASIDQDINNVRARLLTGGDVWWNGDDGRYIVPKVALGEQEVSSLFAGAVWLGGLDPAGNLKFAGQAYGRSQGNFDFYPGPLDPETGEVSRSTCAQWDQFFVVTASEIREHQRLFAQALAGEIEYTDDLIPLGVKGWPGKGNPYFEEVHGFAPPNTNQGLAGFYDYCDDEGECNTDGLYDPLQGDLPIIEIEGCEDFYNENLDLRDAPQFPDQMIFWIYNDNGNVHENSGADIPLQMEVQVQAFAYATNDVLNNMTFQRYKLINRGKELLRDTYFGIWIDGDLGCYTDDYIGCDTTRSLAIYYNQDPIDGSTGTVCEGGVPTYGTEVPIMGIDYFRGPKQFIDVLDSLGNVIDEREEELGMSSFTYFNNASVGNPPPQTTDPTSGVPQEWYNYLSGVWKDGSAYTFGGIGYQTGGMETTYAFPSPPTDESPEAWSMCSENLGEGDRRTIQASGPFRLRSGAINELIIGVPWIPNELTYPCPELTRLLAADDLAQNLFDACFDITDGPDAPDLDIIELDRRLTLVLTNDERASNNAFQAYAEQDLLAPDDATDSLYRFEGYKVYQLRDANVSVADLNDPTQARLISQSDVTNGVGELFNWEALVNPLDPTRPVFAPEPQVNAAATDEGVQTVIRVTTDQFAAGQDPRLINHKPYYFTVVSYAYNNYEDFDPFDGTGQPRPYLEGRNNVRTYVGVPRPITDVVLGDDNATAVVTRLDGVGTGPFFLDLAEGERERLVSGGDFMPVYQDGQAPVQAQVYNPFDAEGGVYRIEFVESGDDDGVDPDDTWQMVDQNGTVVIEGQSFDAVNEQVIGTLGVSVTLGQVVEPGSDEVLGRDNGCIGYEVTMPNGGEMWFQPIPDDAALPIPGIARQIFNFMQTDASTESDVSGNAVALDPNEGLADCFEGQWTTMALSTYRNDLAQGFGFISPAYLTGLNRARDLYELEALNNVDIVFTDNPDLWSRCVIVEMATNAFTAAGGVESVDGADQFDLRAQPSVGKSDADGDGLPDPDGDVDADGDDRMGMGWFPGYAIDVETGVRLNIFFGENSALRFNDDELNPYNSLYREDGELTGEPLFPLTGADMMFNPTDEIYLIPPEDPTPQLFYTIAGGHHFVYVTREPYDECETLYNGLKSNSRRDKREALSVLTYASLVTSSQDFKPYSQGLVPAETVAKLRVNNPYAVAQVDADDRIDEAPTGVNGGYPAYELAFGDVSAQPVPVERGDSILSFVNIVPNPYYGFSEYEIDEFSNIIRITNLPRVAEITIYSLDGKFIRSYSRAETDPGVDVNPDDRRTNNRAIRSRQIYPDLDWDMKNNKGIPVSSGVYLIHVNAFELGERTLKSFIIQRSFDPSGL